MKIFDTILIIGGILVIGFIALRQHQDYCLEHACEPGCPAEDCGGFGE